MHDKYRSGTAKKSFLSTLLTKYINSPHKYIRRPELSTFAVLKRELIIGKEWNTHDTIFKDNLCSVPLNYSLELPPPVKGM